MSQGPYFSEDEVRGVIVSLAHEISRCEFMFDVVSDQGRLVSNELTRDAGYASAPMKWTVNGHDDLSKWGSRVAVIDYFPLFAHIKRTPDFEDHIIQFMDKSDKEGNVSIVHLEIGD